MKKMFLLLLFVSFSIFSQSLENLKTATKKLYQANYLLDFEAIVDLTYPKIAEEFGKDALLEKIEKQYENEEYRLRQQLETVPFKYSEIKKIEGKSFCVIMCHNPTRYLFENKLSTEVADGMIKIMKEQFKATEVTFEPNRNSFNVKKTTTYIAVSDETTNNQWNFFNFDFASQEFVFLSIFSESVQKELGL